MSLSNSKITKILNHKPMFSVLVSLLLAVLFQQMLPANASAQTPNWLDSGNHKLEFVELSEDYAIPSFGNSLYGNFNIDCFEDNKIVVTREAKAISEFPFYQTEETHWFKCNANEPVLTPRGLTDGIVLEAGDIAGKFIIADNEEISPVSGTNTLVKLVNVGDYSQQACLHGILLNLM